eukprot:2504767-Amphidinium_carterae.1
MNTLIIVGTDFPLQENQLRTRTAKDMCNPQFDVETEIAIAGTIHKNTRIRATIETAKKPESRKVGVSSTMDQRLRPDHVYLNILQ